MRIPSLAIDPPPCLHVLQDTGTLFVEHRVGGADPHLKLLPQGPIRFDENRPSVNYLCLHHRRPRAKIDEIDVPTELCGQILL